MLKHLFIVLLIPLFLSGCIGSALLRDVDASQPYPDLHSVPDPESPEDFKKIESVMQGVEQDRRESVRENKRLRTERGLSIADAKRSPLLKRRKKAVKAPET